MPNPNENPTRRRNVYDPKSPDPFRLSRSKLDLFLECRRCFYLDRRLGVARPQGFPFNLNNAVDALLKREFDRYRREQRPHPLMTQFGIDAVPFQHERLQEWRDSRTRGITFPFPGTNLLITGGIDDIWMKRGGELIVVDFKATSKAGEVTLDAPWQDGYKRQMEVYQWLFRKNGFAVDDTGVFVYCNGKADASEFAATLRFDIKLIPYEGRSDWVDGAVEGAYRCLRSAELPEAAEDCDHCRYVEAARERR